MAIFEVGSGRRKSRKWRELAVFLQNFKGEIKCLVTTIALAEDHVSLQTVKPECF